jgi:hypothetical protein
MCGDKVHANSCSDSTKFLKKFLGYKGGAPSEEHRARLKMRSLASRCPAESVSGSKTRFSSKTRNSKLSVASKDRERKFGSSDSRFL